MARQPYFVEATQKKIEVFGSFSGGMVSQAHPEKLRDEEMVLIENGNIRAGGVVEARGGYNRTNFPSPTTITGNSQGRWKYKNQAGGQDICAINGKLYTVSANIYTMLTITNLTGGFQTTRPIEAVQVGTMMYFATGSGLVQYDGTTASLVQAYQPNGLEALYIGTNGYAANPDTYLSDTTGAGDVILGVVPDQRYGVMNQNVTFTAYVQKTNTAVLEYRWEMKTVTALDYTELLGWTIEKEALANFAAKGDYMIRVSLRKQGTTTVLSQYVLPRFKVNTTVDEKPEPTIDFEDMKLCNRIFFHYDRLWMYGDTGNTDHLYISHLNKFNYFPRTNIIRVSDNMKGDLRAVVQYKNFLVCFTDGSIQSILGSSPADFLKQPLHTTLGSKYPYSVQVMKNYITFVGTDNGIYVLKSFNYAQDDKMNVDRIDGKVADNITTDLGASVAVLSAVYDDQYFLYIEATGSTANYVYRFYYELGVWVRDSTTVDFISMSNYNNTLILMEKTGGAFMQLKDNVFFDYGSNVYIMRVSSKNFNFNMPHHRKKLKQFQLLSKLGVGTTIVTKIYTDNTLLSTTNLTYDPAQNSDPQKLKVMGSGRFRYVKFELSCTVRELVQFTGFGFVFKENTPK
jgi:hypothetical protein